MASLTMSDLPFFELDRATSIGAALACERQRIAAATERAQRAPGSTRLMAVSKKQPVEAIIAAYEFGQRDFGENYVQELITKADALAHLADLRWHMIGHLQTNKARQLVSVVESVQTVDTTKLIRELSKQVTAQRPPERGPLEVYVEVNIGREPQKAGVLPENVPELLEVLRDAPRLALKGLLCLPPFSTDPELTRPHFEALARLRDELGGTRLLPELSMGMSHDFEQAIAAGSTWVRLGTAIFGARNS